MNRVPGIHVAGGLSGGCREVAVRCTCCKGSDQKHMQGPSCLATGGKEPDQRGLPGGCELAHVNSKGLI